MIQNKALRTFLAIDKIKALASAWHNESVKSMPGKLGVWAVFFAICISMLPALSYNLRKFFISVDPTTVSVGIATCLAIWFRVNRGIPFMRVTGWKRSLSLTHTAFALGCLPLVIVLIFYPEAFNVIAETTASSGKESKASLTTADTVFFIISVSTWAGLTEEFIFRGLLISTIRRWNVLDNSKFRDILAVGVSAFIFGFSHFFTWGPEMAIVLVGLGVGFGLAYIAIGELLLPVIVYHIMFDIISLSIAIYLR